MGKAKILIADDDADILSITAKKVAAEGYDVTTAVDGDDALHKIQQNDPDVIVLDLTMPKKDGFEVLQALKQRSDAGKWRPVIIVSGRRELEDIRKSYDMDADHYLTKPCPVGEILKAIELMLKLSPIRKSD